MPANVPLCSSPEEAAAFVRHLQSILRHIGASDANMDRVSAALPSALPRKVINDLGGFRESYDAT